MGMQELLQRNSISIVTDPSEADVILLNGGGAMNDLWPTGAAQVLASYIEKYQEKEFVVGPSSYYFQELDFAKIISECRNSITLFCREKVSEAILQSLELPTHCEIFLSDDLALELEGTDFLVEQSGSRTESHILCAMRKDREGEAGLLAKTSAPWLPKFIRKPLSRVRDRLVASSSSDKLSPLIGEIKRNKNTESIIYRDVSVSVPFEEFCRSIRGASAIITNRLHIAILGTLLNKEVHLFEGSYHKARGVYDYSLSKHGTTKLH